MIVLTAEEADKVRGRAPKDSGSILDPVPLRDGRYMLGEHVLDDPAHEDVAEFLRTLPIEPIETLPVYVEGDVMPAETALSSIETRTTDDQIKVAAAPARSTKGQFAPAVRLEP